MDEAAFTLRQVADASGVPVNTIRSWFQRQHLRLVEQDHRAEAHGMAHLVSLRSALRIATMGALVNHGLEPAAAGQAALAWTDVGSSFGEPARDPGALYVEPFTVLCCFSSGGSVVRHMPSARKAIDMLIDPSMRLMTGATIIVLDMIDRRVRLALHPHPRPL